MSEYQELRARLMGALIGLARATDGNEHLITESATAAVVESLAAPEDAGVQTLEALLERVGEEKRKMVPNCFSCASPCGRTSDYDLSRLNLASEEVASLKRELLRGIRKIAGLEQRPEGADLFLFKALIVVGMEDWNADMLRPVAEEMRQLQNRLSSVQSRLPEARRERVDFF